MERTVLSYEVIQTVVSTVMESKDEYAYSEGLESSHISVNWIEKPTTQSIRVQYPGEDERFRLDVLQDPRRSIFWVRGMDGEEVLISSGPCKLFALASFVKSNMKMMNVHAQG
jgi:hypothetical protein